MLQNISECGEVLSKASFNALASVQFPFKYVFERGWPNYFCLISTFVEFLFNVIS